MELYVRVLGPVSVERGGRAVALGGPQRSGVLAMLVLRAGQVVPAEEIIDVLWGEAPPASCRTQLQGLVSGLRRALGAGKAGTTAPIETRAPGYRLRVPDGSVDLEEFRLEVAAARDHSRQGDPAAAAELLRTALARWRGPAFADVPYAALRIAAAELDEMRLIASEDRIDAEIGLGRHGNLIAELGRLAGEHPLRERLHAQYMTALARVGRAADALAVFRVLRERLVEELGIEPSERLQRLHRSVLAGRLGSSDDGREMAARSRPVPHQLPADVPDLVGRDELLDEAVSTLRRGRSAGTPCLVVTGPGGVGKSAFAARLAHLVRAAYPDGQLYARMGGSGRHRRAPGAVLSGFLNALGVPIGGVPADLHDRGSLFRDMLADRRVLLVLDDVADEAQLRALLPAAPGCAVLATSRRRLPAGGGLEVMPLGVLGTADGAALLRAFAGSARVDADADADADAAAEVVRLCGGLPLAIRVAGARLATRPNWPTGHMARRLADSRRRLDWLELSDTGVRASIAESYSELSGAQRRLFRRLGLLKTAEFPAWVAAALLDQPVGDSERLLDDLVDVHLVEPAGLSVTGPRYRLLDLIHLLAGELAGDDRPADRAAAIERAMHGWLDLAITADGGLPHWYGLEPEPAPRWRAPAEAHQAVRAVPLSWLGEERGAILGLVRQAAERAAAEVAWPLAQRVSTYFDLCGRYDEWREILGHGLHAAEAAGDGLGTACMLSLLVDVEASRDKVQDSLRYAERAYAAYQALDGSGHAATMARSRLVRRPHPARQNRDPLSAGFAAYAQIISRRYAGELDGYLELFEQARDAFRSCGARLSELWALKYAGLNYVRARRLSEAARCLRRCQAIIRQLSPAADAAHTGGDIALICAAQGRFDEARKMVEERLRTARIHGHQWSAGKALDTIGEISRAQGDRRAAFDAYMEALGVWRALGAQSRIAHTLCCLADLSEDLGDARASAVYRAEYIVLAE